MPPITSDDTGPSGPASPTQGNVNDEQVRKNAGTPTGGPGQSPTPSKSGPTNKPGMKAKNARQAHQR